MKKLRIDRQGSNINPLSQKRNSLNQQPLFVPYKIDWRPASPSNIQNHSNSKVFFQNMKAELSTIKNDFQKLIRRQINLKLDEQPLKPSNTNKPKSHSTAKKESKYGKQKKEGMKNGVEQEQHFNRILNLQKNLPCSSGHELKQTLAKSLQIRDQRVLTTAFQAVQIPQKQQVANKLNQEENKVLKEKITQLEKEIEWQKAKTAQSQEAKNVYHLQISEKELIIGELMKELQIKGMNIQQHQQQIHNLKGQIDSLNIQRHNILVQGQNLVNQRNFLNQHLSQLSFHHNQINMAYEQLMSQNAQQRDSVINLQRFCQDLQRRCGEVEADAKRKIQYLQRDIQQYQKRQDMFSREIQNLKNQLKQKPVSFHTKDPRPQTSINDQIAQLNSQIFHLEKQVQIEKQLHENLANKYLQQANHGTNMEEIARNFEQKIAMLVEQNTKLKNRINLAQSKAESISLQNKSYLQQIRLYQEREKIQTAKKQISTNEWEELIQQIQRLKLENERLIEQIQMTQTVQETKNDSSDQKSQSLVKLSLDQRTQIEQLKQNTKRLMHQNYGLKKDLQSELAKFALHSKQNLIQRISVEAEAVKKQNNLMKQLLFSVLVEKVGQKEDEQEIAYLMRKIQELKREMIL